VGSRFWPVSTPARPKQLLPLGSGRPLITDTVERALDIVAPGSLRILAGEDLLSRFTAVLPPLPDEAFMAEPMARGTGPVLAWAAHRIGREDPEAVLVSLHSDHVIRPPDALGPVLHGAARLARRENALFTLSARPDRPETGYGYIRTGQRIDNEAGLEAHRVQGFVEKPDRETAERYLAEGYLWNTGMFVWTARTFLEEIRRWAPEIGEHLHLLDRDDDLGFFQACPSVSVDEAVLERSDRVGTVAAPFEWDDVGSWEALSRTRGSDTAGNTMVGDVSIVDGAGNIVYSEGDQVVLWGLSDLVVVNTGGLAVVMPRERAPRLKDLLQALPEGVRVRHDD
jgi:mannose-1-phosphate guanylyltransferase